MRSEGWRFCEESIEREAEGKEGISPPNQLIFKMNASIEASGVFEARKTF